jgi:hypothetical protein
MLIGHQALAPEDVVAQTDHGSEGKVHPSTWRTH